jgi:hypothetical protein
MSLRHTRHPTQHIFQIKFELPAEAPLGGATTVAPCTKGYKIGDSSRSATNGGAITVAPCARALYDRKQNINNKIYRIHLKNAQN